MNPTRIEYLTHVWNPVSMRCTPVSPGCAFCWHLAMDKRFMQHKGAPVLNEKVLSAPLRRKKPARIGVQFMGDLFHKDVPFVFVDKVVEIIDKCPQHSFFMLTKRAHHMRDYFETMGDRPNLYLGVSVEDQNTADERIPLLLQTPAAKRWVSYEPAVGPVDFDCIEYKKDHFESALSLQEWSDTPEAQEIKDSMGGGNLLDWIVMGGLLLKVNKVTAPHRHGGKKI